MKYINHSKRLKTVTNPKSTTNSPKYKIRIPDYNGFWGGPFSNLDICNWLIFFEKWFKFGLGESHSTWANVDGIKIKLISISLDGDSSHDTVVDFSSEPDGYKILKIGNGYSGTLNADTTIEPGTYDDASFDYYNEVDIKAYAYASGKTYYTTANGVLSADGELTSSQIASLNDYDYYHYDFLYTTTAEGPTDTTDTSHSSAGSFPEVVISANDSSVSLQFLIDTYRLVSFWDGEGDRNSTLSPFPWSNNNGYQSTDFFSENTPNFGLSYIPMFVSLNDSGTTIGHIYIVSDVASDVDNYTDGASAISYIVMAFQSDDTYIGSRVIGFDGSDLNPFVSDFTEEGDGSNSFWFYNGEHCSSDYIFESGGGYTDLCSKDFIIDRKITGFTPQTEVDGQSTAVFTNGPACGATIYDPNHVEDWGNRARECLSNDVSYYFKRVR